MMITRRPWQLLLLPGLLAIAGCGAFDDLDEMVVDAAKEAAAETVKDIVRTTIEKMSEELLDVDDLLGPDQD